MLGVWGSRIGKVVPWQSKGGEQVSVQGSCCEMDGCEDYRDTEGQRIQNGGGCTETLAVVSRDERQLACCHFVGNLEVGRTYRQRTVELTADTSRVVRLMLSSCY